MALALLDLIDFDEAGYDVQVDIGTNTHFEIRLGEEPVRRAGVTFVDGVFDQLPLRASEGRGDPLAPPETVRLPAVQGPGRVWAQLYSYKAGKRAPTVSAPLELPGVAGIRARPRRAYAASLSLVEPVMNAPMRAPTAVRTIACRDAPVAQPMSFDTILAEVLRIAQPIVAEVLKSAGGAGGAGGGGGGLGGLGGLLGGGSSSGGATGGAGDLISGLLKAVLAAAPAISGAAAPAPALPVAQPKSIDDGNRFARPQAMAYSEPQFYQQIIAAAIGPLIQALPQLANAANQRDKDQRASADALTGTILKEINQRLLMERILEAQRQAATGGGAAMPSPEDLAKLAAMVGQLPAPAPGAAPAPAVATPQSLSAKPARPAHGKPSARAILEPLPPKALAWHGGTDALFVRSGRVVLRYRFVVAPPVPPAPLAKAILKVVLTDDAQPNLHFEKQVKLKGVAANIDLECAFEPGEIAHLPSGSRLTATATLCWPSRGGYTEALGSMKLVLVGPMFVKARGNEVGVEREVTDMKRWRQFWNKLWEAPTLSGGENGKRRWRIDADVRYAVVLGTDARNGLMETRRQAGKSEPDDDYALTDGKLKSGIEITVPQLAGLRALWELPELPAETVTALADRDFLTQAGGDVVRRIDMKGRAGERGLVWMVPTFRLVDIHLSRVKEAGVAGDVVVVEDLVVQLPMPAALRILAMKSA